MQAGPDPMSGAHKDKVVIVTGASSGLGKTIAVLYAMRGAKITLCGGHCDVLEVKQICESLSGYKDDRYIAVEGDIRDPHIRKRIVYDTLKKFNQLDIVVANAGVISPYDGGIMSATEQTYSNVMDTNLKACFFLIQEAVPYLAKSKGNVVAISSIASQVVAEDITYGMSKAAVDHMVRCLAVELGPMSIRVNAVNPGFLMTSLYLRQAERVKEATFDPEEATKSYNEKCEKYESRIQKEATKQPLGNNTIICDGVAEAVSFLSSDEALFITGQCLFVDAGRKLARFANPRIISSHQPSTSMDI